MKLKTTIFAVALMILSTAAFANKGGNDPVIKILPTPSPSMLKLLYVNDISGTVKVKFYKGTSLIKRDQIKGKEFEKGFVKRYDLSDLDAGIYQVEIACEGMSVKYELSINPDQPLWAKSWSSHLPSGQVIASK